MKTDEMVIHSIWNAFKKFRVLTGDLSSMYRKSDTCIIYLTEFSSSELPDILISCPKHVLPVNLSNIPHL